MQVLINASAVQKQLPRTALNETAPEQGSVSIQRKIRSRYKSMRLIEEKRRRAQHSETRHRHRSLGIGQGDRRSQPNATRRQLRSTSTPRRRVAAHRNAGPGRSRQPYSPHASPVRRDLPQGPLHRSDDRRRGTHQKWYDSGAVRNCRGPLSHDEFCTYPCLHQPRNRCETPDE